MRLKQVTLDSNVHKKTLVKKACIFLFFSTNFKKQFNMYIILLLGLYQRNVIYLPITAQRRWMGAKLYWTKEMTPNCKTKAMTPNDDTGTNEPEMRNKFYSIKATNIYIC